MRVEEIVHELNADYAGLRGTVFFEDGRTQDHLWFRIPRIYADSLRVSGDPFLAALLLPAMIEGQRLEVDAPVSPKLLEATERIQDIYHVWLERAKRIHVGAPLRGMDDEPAGAEGVGSFFSGGVDSFYTLLKHRERIDALLYIADFGPGARPESARGEIEQKLAGAAGELGKRLIVTATNALKIGGQFATWDLYHGAVLAAIGLTCQGFLREALIPAGMTYPQVVPWGTHPLLDPLWSTDHLRFVHDGCERSPGAKVVDWISHSPIALNCLRVCRQPGMADANCGRCEKCLRTMISLYTADALDRCGALPHEIPPGAVRALTLDNPILLEAAEENLALLEAKKTDQAHELRRALWSAVNKGRRIYARRFRLGMPGGSP